MLLFGLILIVLGALAILAGVFGTGHDLDGATFLGLNVPTQVVFFLGLFAGVAILGGLWIAKFGTKRELRHRRDQKRLRELSEKLDRVDAERNRDADEERPGQ
jgi:membrane protein implicated in regulation of membrane protease activity